MLCSCLLISESNKSFYAIKIEKKENDSKDAESKKAPEMFDKIVIEHGEPAKDLQQKKPSIYLLPCLLGWDHKNALLQEKLTQEALSMGLKNAYLTNTQIMGLKNSKKENIVNAINTILKNCKCPELGRETIMLMIWQNF